VPWRPSLTNSDFAASVTATPPGTPFACVVSNSVGVVTSSVARLTVTGGTLPATVVTTVPAAVGGTVTVAAGGSVTFQATVVGASADATYQWLLNKRGSSFSVVAGATSASYTIAGRALTSKVAGNYRLRVSSSAGVAESATVTLVVV
jgi:hypothetical protein